MNSDTSSIPKTLIVIPARLASTRLPRKMLLTETGRPLIQHTYLAAKSSRLASDVVVATDDVLIQLAVQQFGGRALMTDIFASSGTDRVAEVAHLFPDVEIFVNVQGDEPEIQSEAIDAAILKLANNPSADVATLATPIRVRARLENSNCVKLVCDLNDFAMYFSRSMIPFARDWADEMLIQTPPVFLQHIGLYAYRRQFLEQLHRLRPSFLETTEKLEQLRFLQNGYRCIVATIEDAACGIDTREDYDAFVARLNTRERET